MLAMIPIDTAGTKPHEPSWEPKIYTRTEILNNIPADNEAFAFDSIGFYEDAAAVTLHNYLEIFCDTNF
jgi:hypothetical protein